MSKPSILIMEGDKAMKDLVTTILGTYDYHYTWADRGEQGILSTASQRPDIALLDLELPDMNGVSVILKVRSWTNTSIIVISARSEDSGKIATLDAGADDYLTKPFSVDELLARPRSTQRRLRYTQSLKKVRSSLFTNGGLIIDYAVRCACLDRGGLHLIPYEYKLLCLLAHNVGKVLTRSYVTREIWGAAREGDVASLRVFIASPHREIKKNPSQPQYVQTHVGVGYRMMKR